MRIVVTRMLPGGIPSRLAEREPWVWTEDRPLPGERLLDVLADAEGVLTMLTDRIDDELLAAAPRLRVVSQMAVGVDNIDLESCRRRGVAVGHTPDVLTETTADTGFALLAAAVRRLPEGRDVVLAGKWGDWRPDFLLGGDLHGTTLGIVGLGRIGQAVARRAAGFSMRVLYTSRTRKPEVEARMQVGWRSLPALLAEADHVMVCAGLDPGNHHLFGEEQFRAMKKGATFVNLARGGLVDQEALDRALTEGWIGGAALDVTDPEPLPPESRLLSHPNCLVVPHIGSASVATRIKMAGLAVDNLLAGLDGLPLPASPFQVIG